MDWSTYYNMMSMNNWNYPMMNYSMMGYQNPYQNLNMSLWNYQNPYYMPGSNTAGQTNPAFKGNTNTEDKEKSVKEAPVKAEPKDYVSISKDGSVCGGEVYAGKPEEVAEYKKEYDRKLLNRNIWGMTCMIGGAVLGWLTGPKLAKVLKAKPDSLYEGVIGSGLVHGFLPGAVTGISLLCGNGWKKDLKEKYQFEKVNVAA